MRAREFVFSSATETLYRMDLPWLLLQGTGSITAREAREQAYPTLWRQQDRGHQPSSTGQWTPKARLVTHLLQLGPSFHSIPKHHQLRGKCPVSLEEPHFTSDTAASFTGTRACCCRPCSRLRPYSSLSKGVLSTFCKPVTSVVGAQHTATHP